MARKPYEDVEIRGHLIDSLMMPRIMDGIMDLDGEFEVLSFEVGHMKDDPSHAVMRVFGRDAGHLEELLTAITEHGVVAVRPQDAGARGRPTWTASSRRAFYSTTNLETLVRVAAASGCASSTPRWTAASASTSRPARPRPWPWATSRPASSTSPATRASACCRSSARARASRSSSWPRR